MFQQSCRNRAKQLSAISLVRIYPHGNDYSGRSVGDLPLLTPIDKASDHSKNNIKCYLDDTTFQMCKMIVECFARFEES